MTGFSFVFFFQPFLLMLRTGNRGESNSGMLSSGERKVVGDKFPRNIIVSLFCDTFSPPFQNQ